MKIKRIIAAVTALMFIGETYAFVSSETSKSITAFAAETVEATSVTEKGVSYNVYGDYATVAEVNGELGCEIVISDDIGGKPVKAIEKGAFYAVKDKVKSVTLGNNIESVYERTFYEFSELATVKLGEAVETIGNCAFAYCPKLESVSFGKNLTTIEKCAFFSCPSLVSLEFPDSLTFIDDYAFEMCTGISKVKFGKNLQHLGNCAFKDSSNITEVNLGENLEYIGSAVFSGENLRRLVIPEKVSSLGRFGCPLYFKFALKNRDTAIVIENPECKIGDYLTYSVDYLDDYNECVIVSADGSSSRKTAEELKLRFCTIEDYEKGNYERLTSINDLIESYGMTFVKSETGLTLTGASKVDSSNTKIIIPDAVDGVPVTAIGDEAFKGKDIQYVYFGENITEVGESAFEGCKILYMAVLNDNLKSVGKSAFSGCVNMKEIVVGDNIEDIGENAFFRCSYIEDFNLTDNLKYIGRKAFGRTRIREITIPSSVTVLNGCPFDCMDSEFGKPEGMEYITDVRIMNPECVLSYCDSADEWKDCTIISEEGEPQKFAKLNSIRHCTSEEYENHDYIEYKLSYFGKSAVRQYGMRFTKTEDGAELTEILIPEDGVIVIPDEVETIPVTSISPDLLKSNVLGLEGEYAVKKVKIGQNVKCIPQNLCYTMPNLRIVDIGDGVEKIEKSAFEDCETLTSVSFGKNIKEIDYGAFYFCGALQSDIDLHNVVSIGDYAFSYSLQIKNINFGNKLKSIGDYAFSHIRDYKVLDLPDSLESIGDHAFDESYALEEVNFGSGLKTIGDYAFADNSLLKKAVLNEGLTELGKGVFENCYLLSEVSIPTTLTEIKESTFDYTSIKSLVLPRNIKSVGKYAYYSLYCNEESHRAEEDSFSRMITLPLLDGEVSIKILNPDCEIAEKAFMGNFNVMYGYKDSTVEKYMADIKKSDLFVPITDEYLAGDTNCDGVVDLADAVLIMQALANPNKYGMTGTAEHHLTAQGRLNADMNGDGLTVGDAQSIQKKLLGLE